MTFWEAAAIVLKRWYVVAPLLVLCTSAAIWGANGVGREYTTKASVAVLAPEVFIFADPNGEPYEDPNNPFVESAAARTLGRALPEALTASSMRRQMREEGFTDYYDVVVEDIGNIIKLAATDADPEQSQRTVDRLLTQLQDTADRLQLDAGAPEAELAVLQPLGRSEALLETSQSNRALAVYGLVGAVVSFGAAFLVDGWAERRRNRRAMRRLQADLDEWGTADRRVPVSDG